MVKTVHWVSIKVFVAEQAGLRSTWSQALKTGLEVVELRYSPRLKIKRNDWLLGDTCKQPILALYFESQNELKIYNIEARYFM